MADTPDLENMPLEELAALANAQPEVVEEVEPAVEQPRNPDGTFAAPVAAEPVVVPTTFSRTIDLGDGSGKQVFTADSLEALVDKLTDAQTHATRKIKELNGIVKAAPAPAAPKVRTPDEEYLLGQRLSTEPTKAMRELLEQEFGMPFEEIKKSTAQARQIATERVEEANAKVWVDAHPDYNPIPENGRKIRNYINRFLTGGLTQENMEQAYNDLNSEGLLKARTAEAAVVEPVPAVVAPKKRASSLSSRISTVVAPPTDPQFPFGDPNTMTLEQIEVAAAKQAAQSR